MPKPIRIKVINGNTFQAMTDNIGEVARAAASAGTDIVAVANDGRMQAITVFIDQAPDFGGAPHP